MAVVRWPSCLVSVACALRPLHPPPTVGTMSVACVLRSVRSGTIGCRHHIHHLPAAGLPYSRAMRFGLALFRLPGPHYACARIAPAFVPRRASGLCLRPRRAAMPAAAPGLRPRRACVRVVPHLRRALPAPAARAGTAQSRVAPSRRPSRHKNHSELISHRSSHHDQFRPGESADSSGFQAVYVRIHLVRWACWPVSSVPRRAGQAGAVVAAGRGGLAAACWSARAALTTRRAVFPPVTPPRNGSFPAK